MALNEYTDYTSEEWARMRGLKTDLMTLNVGRRLSTKTFDASNLPS